MTKLAILSDKERTIFDSPPKFNTADRSYYFSLDQSMLNVLQALRTTTNKVGFMLQYGYFKAYRKFSRLPQL
jgi:hypothetical protein